MSRRLVQLLLVVSLLWQPMSAWLPWALELRAQAITHAVVHGQDQRHHHHDDASLHLDGEASVPHHHVLDGAQPAGLAVQVHGLVTPRAPTGVVAVDMPVPPSPDLPVLRRPPRATFA